MAEKKFNFGWLSQYRDELFGLAIISIIFFHFTVDYKTAVSKELIETVAGVSPFLVGWHNVVRSTGVEIFMFLSGMGCFYSFSKSEKVLAFYYHDIFLRVASN